jgi:hypothetical protein
LKTLGDFCLFWKKKKFKADMKKTFGIGKSRFPGKNDERLEKDLLLPESKL